MAAQTPATAATGGRPVRRRRGVLVAALAVAAVLLVPALRPDGDGDPTQPDRLAAPAAGPDGPRRTPASHRPPPPGHHHPDPAPSSIQPVGTATPAPLHDSGGATGVEELDPAAAAAAVRAAEEFAAAWSAPGPGWHERVATGATAALAASLAGASPVDPAPRHLGAGSLLHGTPAWARVRVPTDRGDVVLDLTLTGSQWLVSAVDWQPA